MRLRGFISMLVPLGLAAAAAAVEAPALLQRQLPSARVGDLLDISSLYPAPPSLPTLSVARTWTDGTLIVSDSPEYVTAPGILYGDTLPPGPVRLMLYHVNATADPGHTRQTLKLGVVVEPADPQSPPTVTMRRKIVHGPSADYFGVGLSSAFDQVSVPDAPASAVITAPALLDPGLESRPIPATAYDPLLEAVYDFDIAGGGLKITVAALKSTAATLATYRGLAPLARETTSSGGFVHDRGTFPNAAGKQIAVANGNAYATSMGTVHIRAGGGLRDTAGPDPDAGEGTQPGYDGLLGTPATMRGNYGVLYRFDLKALSPDGRRVAVLLNPRGGTIGSAVWTGGAMTGEGAFYAPANAAVFSSTMQATLLGRWDPAKAPTIEFLWTPPGSTSLPVEFILIPYPEPGDANGNGSVDLPDAVLAMRFAAGRSSPTARQRIAADVDGDMALTLADVRAILLRCSGLG